MSTETEQRIAIAEHMGWTHCRPWKPDSLAVGRSPGCKKPEGILETIPFFTRDLDAMHAAENRLSDDDFAKYYHILESLYLEKTKGLTPKGMISASASERAAAYMSAIAK